MLQNIRNIKILKEGDFISIMQDRKRLFVFISKALIFLVVGFLAIYARTYSLHGGPFWAFRSSESMAREIVDQGVKEQVWSSFKDLPHISSREKVRLADLQIRRLKQAEQGPYESAVKNATKAIDHARSQRVSGARYLLEADPYHYLYQTERLLETGRISDFSKAGKTLQTLMRAPHGHWEVWSLHPYVGLLGYRMLHLIDPEISLTQAVSFVPLFLTLLVLLGYGGFGRVLKLPWAASVAGMMTLALSPIFIQRSALGWYDTDPYNYLFPILILSFIFWGLQDRKRFWVGVLSAAFLTGLYSLFWTGWSFILVLVPTSLLASSILLMLFRRSQPESLAREGVRFAGIYLVAAGVFLSFFLTPRGLWDSVRGGWSVLNQFALAEFDVWPNVFLTVGEAGGITLKKLIFLTGNYVTFVFGLAGVFLEGRRSFSRGDLFAKFRFLFLVTFSIPVLFMSLKTERFSLLFVLPLAVFVSFAVARILEFFGEVVARAKRPSFLTKWAFARPVVLFGVALVFLPLMLISAHVVAGGIQPIMDDVWNKALLEMRKKTPADSIVNSWWPPGYFITGVAHRRVTADGGTQHFHETYWMAKALMAEDEREAAGILRMLNLSGDDAFGFLTASGMKTPDAVDLILKIVRVSRTEAFRELPSIFTEEQKKRLLDMTHDSGDMPPSYVLIYNDLVEQNLAVSVMAQWDFRRAMDIQGRRREGSRGVLGALGKNSASGYIRDLLSISGEFARYTPASPLVQREGNFLFFGNGVRVDLSSMEALVFIPSKKIQGKPASFFYLDQGKLVEKAYSGDRANVSVLFFEDTGIFYCVMADARLIRSLLFRLYYLKGEGLDLFKPWTEEGSLSGGTVVRVFELDREKLAR
jgi:dolichyl-phosphooligosaccharide-protein glycotransferase